MMVLLPHLLKGLLHMVCEVDLANSAQFGFDQLISLDACLLGLDEAQVSTGDSLFTRPQLRNQPTSIAFGSS